MKKADLSIAFFGMTAFELAAMGIPSILICLSQDHMKSATVSVEAGASIFAGVKGTINETDIKNISKIIADDLNLRKMFENGVQFIDGKGRERIAKTIDHYFTKEFQNL